MDSSCQVQSQSRDHPWLANRTRRSAATAAGIALLAFVCIGDLPRSLLKMFWVSSVTLHEAYPAEGSAKFDHADFDALLHEFVDGQGWVDYQGMHAQASMLDGYINALAAAPFCDLSRDAKLAFLINAYNAFTLRLILDHYPIQTIKDIPSGKRWDAKRWQFDSKTFSLNQIEHEQIRPKFAEPRIHFALVCAAIGCPPLRNEAYQADKIEAQLQDQAVRFHANRRWFRYDPESKTAHLSKLYDWYGGDFKQAAPSVLDFAARHAPSLKAALEHEQAPSVRWLDYDWTLNGKQNKP